MASVTTLGSGVDGSVRKIGRTYTWSGALASLTSYNASDAILNEIKYEYDSNHMLSRLYQSHSGAVNVFTTPYLQYSYAGIANSFRMTGMIYPSGKTISHGYDGRNNLTTISEGSTTLVSYVHSGTGIPMQTTYNQPGLSLDYTGGGLDRYGRIIDHAWKKAGADVVCIQHGYDYASNRTYRNDLVQAANSELYQYDQINQIKNLNRGVLNQNQTAIVTPNFMEAWNLDKTGNWLQYDKNGTVENRTHNKANEIQGIATHDKNGNMTVLPGQKAKYDAWNRLVEVRDTSDNLIARYDYNGMNQRIRKTVGTTVTESFFNEQWQELESSEPQSGDCVSYV